MLFFITCACFALFPEQVLYGAQNGLALCINAVIPSLLPFMLVSSCIIKSNFSKPLGVLISKVITPLTGISPGGCVCFVTGILGGYGAGARAVCDSFRQGIISKKEAEKLLPFCNNAGPLFVIGTVGIGFFASKSTGMLLWMVQLLTALVCVSFLGGNYAGKSESIRQAWKEYKNNKPSFGKLVTQVATESGAAIVTACVFVITFSALAEVIPLGKYGYLSGILEITRAVAQLARPGMTALPLISALIAWGGISVHFQASALSEGIFSMKNYYFGKIIEGLVAFILALMCLSDVNILVLISVICIGFMVFAGIIKKLFSPKSFQRHGFRLRRRS